MELFENKYRDLTYYTRVINYNGRKVTVSTETLNIVLETYTDFGNKVDEEALAIANDIFCYVPDDTFYESTDEELEDWLRAELEETFTTFAMFNF